MLNIGICLALVFAYYVFYSSGITLGAAGAVPLVAAWTPNIVMARGGLGPSQKAETLIQWRPPGGSL